MCAHSWITYVRETPEDQARRICKTCGAFLGYAEHDDTGRIKWLIASILQLGKEKLSVADHNWIHAIRHRDKLTYDEHMRLRQIMGDLENGGQRQAKGKEW